MTTAYEVCLSNFHRLLDDSEKRAFVREVAQETGVERTTGTLVFPLVIKIDEHTITAYPAGDTVEVVLEANSAGHPEDEHVNNAIDIMQGLKEGQKEFTVKALDPQAAEVEAYTADRMQILNVQVYLDDKGKLRYHFDSTGALPAGELADVLMQISSQIPQVSQEPETRFMNHGFLTGCYQATFIKEFEIVKSTNELEALGERLSLSYFGEYCPQRSLRGYSLDYLLSNPENYRPLTVVVKGEEICLV